MTDMPEQDNRLMILVTNDDGIMAEGLRILTEIAKEFGQVTVVAPELEQSAKSHSITVRTPVKVKEVVGDYHGVPAYTVSGSPADCVKAALEHLELRPDLVLSGINNGPNLGYDILYSGTVGAASEAIAAGVPAVAISCQRRDFSLPEQELKRVLELLFQQELWHSDAVINVNFPVNGTARSKGIRFTRQGKQIEARDFVYEDGVVWKRGPATANEPDTDVAAAIDGYISITPLSIDRTRDDLLAKWRSGLDGDPGGGRSNGSASLNIQGEECNER